MVSLSITVGQSASEFDLQRIKPQRSENSNGGLSSITRLGMGIRRACASNRCRAGYVSRSSAHFCIATETSLSACYRPSGVAFGPESSGMFAPP